LPVAGHGITINGMGNTAMRAVSFKLPPELDDKLTETARRRGISRSAALREALEAFDAGPPPLSVTEAAGKLVGSVSGPRDLSTSRRHMRGYGR
jgi:hypothetical protein